MGVRPEAANVTEQSVSIQQARRISPRLLGLIVVFGIMATLGIGALADTLAVAPLRPPTRAGASQRAGLYTLALAVSPEPLTAGSETAFSLQVTDVSGAPVTGATVICDFTMPAMPMPTMLVTASDSGSGVYTCQEALTDPGAWSLGITLTPHGSGPVHTAFALQAR